MKPPLTEALLLLSTQPWGCACRSFIDTLDTVTESPETLSLKVADTLLLSWPNLQELNSLILAQTPAAALKTTLQCVRRTQDVNSQSELRWRSFVQPYVSQSRGESFQMVNSEADCQQQSVLVCLSSFSFPLQSMFGSLAAIIKSASLLVGSVCFFKAFIYSERLPYEQRSLYSGKPCSHSHSDTHSHLEAVWSHCWSPSNQLDQWKGRGLRALLKVSSEVVMSPVFGL